MNYSDPIAPQDSEQNAKDVTKDITVVVDVPLNDDIIKDKEPEEEVVSEQAMKAMEKAAYLGKGPLLKTIWSTTYPDFIAKAITALYSMVDSMFVGNYAGNTIEERKVALAGIACAFPLEESFLSGFSLLIGQGAGPNYGRFLGKRDEKDARRTVGNTLFMDIILGIIFAIILPPSARWLLSFMGASDEAGTMKPAMTYLVPLMYADILYNVCFGCNNLIRAEGAALYSCALLGICGTFNIIFDFIFIKEMQIGVVGGAMSTISAYTIATSFGLWFFISHRAAVVIQWKDFKPDPKLMKAILTTGLSGLVSGVATGIISLSSNRLVINYSPYPIEHPLTTAAIAAAGSMTRMQSFCFIPINSIAHGLVALLSYCRGAKLYKRFIDALKICFIGQLIVAFVLSIACYTLSVPLAKAFNTDPEFVKIFSEGMKYMSFLLCLAPFSCTLFPALQAIGRGGASAYVLMSRSCLFNVLFQFILCNYRKDYWGVFMAYPLAEAAAAISSIIIFLFVQKDIKGEVIPASQI